MSHLKRLPREVIRDNPGLTLQEIFLCLALEELKNAPPDEAD